MDRGTDKGSQIGGGGEMSGWTVSERRMNERRGRK